MLEFFANNFSGCVWLAVVLLAMIPTIESKVAIPFALSVQIWGESVLTPFTAGLFAFIGSIIPSSFLICTAKKIKAKTSGFVYEKFVTKFEQKYKDKLEKVKSKSTTFKKCALLTMFVAIPLPLTGVYTGSLIAGFTNLKIWQGFLSVIVGAVISCLIIVLLCTIFENSAFYIFVVSLILCLLYIVFNCLVYFFKKKSKCSVSKANKS